MNIKISETITGARQARGLVVIIDVFRAFSLEPWLYARGAKEILAVGKKETALALRELHPDYILCGERKGIKLPGFDYGNSPSQTADADLTGRTVVHTTSAGTQGLAAAVGSEGVREVIAASLVNARAVASYIRERDPEEVTLVAMGLHGTISAPEDLLCAAYIRSLLQGSPLNMEQELLNLRETESAKRFFRPENADVFPQGDYGLCTAVDRFDFVLRAEQIEKDTFRMEKVSC